MKLSRLVLFLVIFSVVGAQHAEAFGKPKKLHSFSLDRHDNVGVLLTWVPHKKADSAHTVIVERGTGDIFEERVAVPVSTLSVYDATAELMYDTPYQYRACVMDEKGRRSKWLYSDSLTLPKPQHEAVDSFNVTQGDDGLVLSWDGERVDSRYIVVERSSEYGSFEYIAQVPEFAGIYEDLAVEDGQQYRYQVYVAEDEDGRSSEVVESELVEYALLRFNAPEQIETAEVDDGIYVSWRHPSLISPDIAVDDRPVQVTIERALDGGQFDLLTTTTYREKYVHDADRVFSGQPIGSEGDYQLRGNSYQYRVRFEGHGECSPSQWVVSEPLVVAQRHFSTSAVLIASEPNRVALVVSWDDVHGAKNPEIQIERKRNDGVYSVIAVIPEDEGMYCDNEVEEREEYMYRVSWKGDSDILGSGFVEVGPVRYVSPAYALPEQVRVDVNDSIKKSYVNISWIQPYPDEDPAIEVQYSMNSRDYESVGTVQMHEQVFSDRAVSSEGGFVRKHLGKRVRMNVYRYRLRCLGGNSRHDSEWIETDDVIIYEVLGA